MEDPVEASSSPLPDRLLTIEEFERLPEEDGYLLELVRGRIVREPRPAYEHGRLVAEIAARLREFARHQNLGVVVVEAGFALSEEPSIVRGPDVAFVSRERAPERGRAPTFPRLAPDLAVEVASPSNTLTELHDKALDYLEAGTRLVWLVEPSARRVTVLRSREDIRILREGDSLDCGDVLPGFRTTVAELLDLT